jgi:hypothetical protein
MVTPNMTGMGKKRELLSHWQPAGSLRSTATPVFSHSRPRILLRVQALPGNELLRDLPLELNAVGTLSGHGFHPLKAQLTLSNH